MCYQMTHDERKVNIYFEQYNTHYLIGYKQVQEVESEGRELIENINQSKTETE